jgi:hypothetical protein
MEFEESDAAHRTDSKSSSPDILTQRMPRLDVILPSDAAHLTPAQHAPPNKRLSF